MLTTTSHTPRSAARTPEKPHVFTFPVVREMPRPAPEPAAWSCCW